MTGNSREAPKSGRTGFGLVDESDESKRGFSLFQRRFNGSAKRAYTKSCW